MPPYKKKRKRQDAQVFTMTKKLVEDHGSPIYAVQFNFTDLRHKNIFATVGNRRASAYKLGPDGSVEPLHSFVDENKSEELYTCAWSYDPQSGAPWLITAGALGIIKVLNCHTLKVEKILLGHVNAINELQVHPLDRGILLSASKDRSVRLWSIQTGKCLVVFAGENGHRDEVLSADFHLSGSLMVSSSMDHTVKVWDLSKLEDIISGCHEKTSERRARRSARVVQFPLFSTRKVHGNYVDCVRFFGDLVISKSVEDCIVLWRGRYPEKPKLTRMPNNSVRKLGEYRSKDCDIWYIRFGMDYTQKYLAVGNKKGDIFVWDIDHGRNKPPLKLNAKSHCSAVRQVAFDYAGNHVVGVCDDATIWVWKRNYVDTEINEGEKSKHPSVNEITHKATSESKQPVPDNPKKKARVSRKK